jgi:flagellar hook protein FlgE
MQALAIAASALVAQTAVVSVAARNIANAVTPGYTAKTAQLVSMNPGVRVGAIVDGSSGVDGPSGVDPARAFVSLILARTAYRAALKVAATAEQASRTLLARA